MLYSLQAGGKRIRPMLVYAVLSSYKKEMELGDDAALAIEMIHTYSLVHDDLPAMDDDDMRRGKPTNHKVFGEATAILAGDALLTYSIQLIRESSRIPDSLKLDIIGAIVHAAGPNGMVGGQMADMEAEKQQVSVEELEKVHEHKTGDLLAVALESGAILAEASNQERLTLAEFGHHIGLAFQIKDDILDVEGDEEEIGKPVGSDQGNDKSTYVSILGLDGAKEKLAYHTKAALHELSKLSADTSILEELALYIENRSS
ncbi:polyprenyl synthetase family protein [Paenalkalicoccus suaedae]|uniref:Farnesyl diphosphate synthase n=2 Tax=Paenalkalicoccus suaedae TaxID=2592382 RepID=A0A859FKA7_9BACI|nr:polyprenyl synthetase family protein [Paenalkalicoccus suaedae]